MFSRQFISSVCLCGAVMGNLCIAQTAPRLPIEAFGMLPIARQVRMSPDGTKVAMLANDGGTSAIVVREIEKPNGKTSVLLNSNNREFKFRWLRWVSNERLLVAIIFPSKRRVNSASSSVGGIETYESRLMSVKIDGSPPINLLKPHTFTGELQAQFQDDVIDFYPDDGKHVLLQLSDPYDGGDPAVYSLNVENGERRQLHNARENFRDWMVDRNHRVRIGVRTEKGTTEIHACDPEGNNWRRLWSFKILAKETVSPMGFGVDPNQLYILAEHEGRDALFTVDLRDPTLKRTLKLASKTNDISGRLAYSKVTGEPVGLVSSDTFNQTESSHWDIVRKDLVSSINEALPSRHNRIISSSDDDNKYLVLSSNDKVAGEIYLGDKRANTMGFFLSSYPQLQESYMVTKKFIQIKARDGLELPGYLSTPLGIKANNLPTILLVHGGPQSHDDADFDSWTQFLTNRGYAVLQINSRGSTGFGNRLMSAGLKKWGQEMQDDWTDALAWAVAEKISDPKRICIVGGSYGGYAALMGVAKTPDLFKCAVSFAGVTDLYELGRDHLLYRDGKDVFEAQVGSVEMNPDQLRQNSPRLLAKQIKSPVLLIHGTEDRSVPFNQGEYMDTALTEAGVPHKFIKQLRGDHHLSIYEHSVQFCTELESFLATNLATGVASK